MAPGADFNPQVIAGWSSLVARQAHNLKVVGSNPTPATTVFGIDTSPYTAQTHKAFVLCLFSRVCANASVLAVVTNFIRFSLGSRTDSLGGASATGGRVGWRSLGARGIERLREG